MGIRHKVGEEGREEDERQKYVEVITHLVTQTAYKTRKFVVSIRLAGNVCSFYDGVRRHIVRVIYQRRKFHPSFVPDSAFPLRQCAEATTILYFGATRFGCDERR